MRKVIRLRSGGLTCSNFIRDNLEMQIHIKLFAWILIYYELEAFHPFSTWCMLCFQQNRKTEREPMRFVWFSIHGTAKSNFFSKQGQRIPQLVNFKTHLKTWWQYFLLHVIRTTCLLYYSKYLLAALLKSKSPLFAPKPTRQRSILVFFYQLKRIIKQMVTRK